MGQESLLLEWLYRVRRWQTAHELSAGRFQKRNRRLGLWSAILSAVVGTTVFASLQQTDILEARVLVGLVSLAAAVLASLSAFLSYSDIAAKHRTAAVAYGVLRAELEELQVIRPPEPQLQEMTGSLRKRWEKLDSDSPILTPAIWEKAKGILKEKKVRRPEWPLNGTA